MAEAMRTILRDEGLWSKYSRNAYKITENLHPDQVNEKWENFILSMMKS